MIQQTRLSPMESTTQSLQAISNGAKRVSRFKFLILLLLPTLSSCNFQPWYSFVIDSQGWEAQQIQVTDLPESLAKLYFESPVPQAYTFTSEGITFVATINPRNGTWPVNVQFKITSDRDIEVEPSWSGDCGKIGALDAFDPTFVATNPYFIPESASVVFLWLPGTWYCSDFKSDDAPDEASQHPLVFKITDSNSRASTEINVKFRIVENGWILRGWI